MRNGYFWSFAGIQFSPDLNGTLFARQNRQRKSGRRFMLEDKSVAELREAIHALAQAIALIPEIYVPQDGKAKRLEGQIFSELIKEALVKSSRQ
jgi:hypothetical protein